MKDAYWSYYYGNMDLAMHMVPVFSNYFGTNTTITTNGVVIAYSIGTR